MKAEEFLKLLETRFRKNPQRHQGLEWNIIEEKLRSNPEKTEILIRMETTGGEPDVLSHDENSGQFIFMDCSAESPNGRRSFCYDRAALEKRKENKPKNNVLDAATEMGIQLLDEGDYRFLQTRGKFDTKTSSWLKTPDSIRDLGGAIFGDFRYGSVFIYHNGADSYYAARGFRGKLNV